MVNPIKVEYEIPYSDNSGQRVMVGFNGAVSYSIKIGSGSEIATFEADDIDFIVDSLTAIKAIIEERKMS